MARKLPMSKPRCRRTLCIGVKAAIGENFTGKTTDTEFATCFIFIHKTACQGPMSD